MRVATATTSLIAMRSSTRYVATVDMDGDGRNPYITIRGVISSSKKSGVLQVSIKLVSVCHLVAMVAK